MIIEYTHTRTNTNIFVNFACNNSMGIQICVVDWMKLKRATRTIFTRKFFLLVLLSAVLRLLNTIMAYVLNNCRHNSPLGLTILLPYSHKNRGKLIWRKKSIIKLFEQKNWNKLSFSYSSNHKKYSDRKLVGISLRTKPKAPPNVLNMVNLFLLQMLKKWIYREKENRNHLRFRALALNQRALQQCHWVVPLLCVLAFCQWGVS